MFRKAFSSVTIMVIPHENSRTFNLKIPVSCLCISALLALIGGTYVVGLAISGLEYKAQHHVMVEKVRTYSNHFYQWSSTVMALRTVEAEFRQLFDLETKEEILELVDTSFKGSIDIPDLAHELQITIDSVDEIKNYLREQKDIFVATPRGFPVSGRISSNYGRRADPISGERNFHSGIDISAAPGTPIRATADGVVSHSGWTNTSGYVVVLEHGCGYSTLYAHNRSNVVKVGESVSRGDVIAYVGSTGKSTGPHVHYEIWKEGINVNPKPYVNGDMYTKNSSLGASASGGR
jgi:murein DD-endopeptidase MepM/ murein hydrolase activator NlpD